MRIAVIGLGNMGGPMAANLVKAGHSVHGFDLVAANNTAAQAEGVTIAASGSAAVADADIVVTMSKLPFAGFVDGTGGTEKGMPNAKVWSEKAKFEAAAKTMQDEVVKLAAAAKTNNLDQLKTAFGSAAGTCKACHDDYRNP